MNQRQRKESWPIGPGQAALLFMGGLALGLVLMPLLVANSFASGGSFVFGAAIVLAIAIRVMAARLAHGSGTGVAWLLGGLALGGALYLAWIVWIILAGGFDGD